MEKITKVKKKTNQKKSVLELISNAMDEIEYGSITIEVNKTSMKPKIDVIVQERTRFNLKN